MYAKFVHNILRVKILADRWKLKGILQYNVSGKHEKNVDYKKKY